MDNNSGQDQQDRKKKSSEIEIVNVPTSKRVLSSWAKQIQAISKENSLKVVEESPLFDFSIDDDEDDITYYCSSSIMSEEDQVPMSLNCKQEEDIVKSTLYKFNYKEDVILVDDMFNFDFKSLCNKFGEPLFEGVLIDPPYDTIDIKDLKKLPLNEDWFLTRGYCFIWIEKEYTVQVIKIMKEFEFEYVDSLCWIKERLDQSFSKEENSNLLPKTKLTLFIFRKKNDKTKNMPIKHQRSPDVILDFKRDNPRERSPLIFNMIETLLYNSTRFLEIWGEGVYNNVEYKTNTKWITLKSAPKEEKLIICGIINEKTQEEMLNKQSITFVDMTKDVVFRAKHNDKKSRRVNKELKYNTTFNNNFFTFKTGSNSSTKKRTLKENVQHTQKHLKIESTTVDLSSEDDYFTLDFSPSDLLMQEENLSQLLQDDNYTSPSSPIILYASKEDSEEVKTELESNLHDLLLT
ncbi:hypothetical protein ABK040_001830 [Willaertia magna]